MKEKSRLKQFYENEFVNNKFSYLFLTVVFYFVLEPFLSPIIPVLFSFFFIFVILTVLRALKLTKRILNICAMIVFIAFICDYLIQAQFVSGGTTIYFVVLMTVNTLYAFFLFMAIVLLLKDLFSEKNVTSDTVSGGIAVYFLMGVFWALLYSLIFLFDTGAFSISNNSNDLSQFVYFSFTTITTLGYGDMVPITRIARNMTLLESTIGQIFLTVFIARLVGLQISSKMK